MGFKILTGFSSERYRFCFRDLDQRSTCRAEYSCCYCELTNDYETLILLIDLKITFYKFYNTFSFGLFFQVGAFQVLKVPWVHQEIKVLQGIKVFAAHLSLDHQDTKAPSEPKVCTNMMISCWIAEYVNLKILPYPLFLVSYTPLCAIVGPPGKCGPPGKLGPDCKTPIKGPCGDPGCPGQDGEPGQTWD